MPHVSSLEPLVPETGVLALVPDRWSDRWQPRHHVLSRLARYFRVLWMNPAPHWRGLPTEVRQRVWSSQESTQHSGFTIYVPDLWLPRVGRAPWLDTLTWRLRLQRARNILLGQGCREIILYIWRPEFAAALDTLAFDLSCYHIDDEYSFSEIEQPLSDVESGILRRANEVFVHSPALLEKKGLINPHTTFVPNGVDYAAHATKVDEPADLASIPHPRIGYAGWLKSQLDWRLLLDLVGRHPKWSFVFVGAQHDTHRDIIAPVRELANRPNVYFLGAKSTKELAAYPQYFDVGIMPYRSTAYTKYIYPMKLHEYLASGIPTVGTRLRSLEAFEDVVALPTSRDQWSAALTDALDPAAGTTASRAARQNVARRHDWDVLVKRIAEIFAARLGHGLLTAAPGAAGQVVDGRLVGGSQTSV